ncbi:MAG: G-D-S-L family lipolytic protein [Bacteroidetes bacterium]|nr:MAG: G-D-S-L family lipolytic protein [Bacteroidota bacterium]
MKKINFKTLMVIFASAFFVASCKPDIEVPTPDKGTADFTKYVAVGNSLTAGYADGGVYRDAQLNSYPALIAKQMKLAGGGEFIQPLYSEAQTNGTGYLKLKGLSATGVPNLAPEISQLGVIGLGADRRTPLYAKFTGANNNLGVPGIRVADVLQAGYGLNNPLGFNPHFERLLPDNSPKTYAQYAEESNPTFFSCWLGNNDVLGYATSGGTASITPDALFRNNFSDIMTRLTAKGAKGVTAYIPDVTVIPYLNTVTVAAAKLQVKALTGRDLDIFIRTGAGLVRRATNEDLITLQADSLATPNALGLPKGLDPRYPLNNEDVLDKDEVATASAAVLRFNAIIKEVADSKKVPVVDTYNYLNTFKGGRVVNGLSLNTGFISGGLFSLDGVHLTPRGYAMTANEFLKVINASYNANLPLLDISQYAGVTIK